MDLADVSLVAAAELGHGRILSTGERDLGVDRWSGTEPFESLLLTPPLCVAAMLMPGPASKEPVDHCVTVPSQRPPPAVVPHGRRGLPCPACGRLLVGLLRLGGGQGDGGVGALAFAGLVLRSYPDQVGRARLEVVELHLGHFGFRRLPGFRRGLPAASATRWRLGTKEDVRSVFAKTGTWPPSATRYMTGHVTYGVAVRRPGRRSRPPAARCS